MKNQDNKRVVTLKETCFACPEQYDAFVGKKMVGYLRLRHGLFYVACVFCGEHLYERECESGGRFEDWERDLVLTRAKLELEHHHCGEN